MTIKKGMPIVQSVLADYDLRVARALSITTVEELLSLYIAFPKQTSGIFKETNWDRLSQSVPRTIRSSMNRRQLDDIDRMKKSVGTGARPPSEERRTQKAMLYLEDVDLRPGGPSDKPKVFLSGCTSPIRNQGKRQTCVAFAVSAMQECLELRKGAQGMDLSEQFMYWRCKLIDGFPNDPGTWQRVAVPEVVANGICKESLWGYRPHPIPDNEGQGPPPRGRDAVFDDATHYKPMQGVALDPNSVDSLIRVLDNGLVAAVSLPVYSNWWNRATQMEGHIPMPLPGEASDGGHAMCVVGYGYDTDFLGGG